MKGQEDVQGKRQRQAKIERDTWSQKTKGEKEKFTNGDGRTR